MSVFTENGARFVFLGILSLFSFAFIGPETGLAADECDVHEARILTTPAPPQWAPTYKRYDALLADFPAKADVVLFGDSLAQGWPDASIGVAFPNKMIGNLGLGGDMIQTALWRLERMPVKQLSPETIVVLLGTNNLSAGSKPCAIEAGLTKTIEKLHELWPHAVMYLFQIPPRGKIFRDFEANRQAVNAFIEKVPSQHNYVRAVTGFDDLIACGMRAVDQLQEWFPSYFPDNCANFSQDSLHLSDAGYDVLSGILMQGNH